MAARRPLTTPTLPATYTLVDNNQLTASLSILNEINDVLGKEVNSLNSINEQYEFANNLLFDMQAYYQNIADTGIANNRTISEINVSISEQRKLLEKNLEARTNEQHLLNGLNVVYSQINQQIDKSVGLASTFKKEGEAMFAPKMLQPALKAFQNFEARFGKFGEERNRKINEAIDQLRKEGKTAEAAMIELQESNLYKLLNMTPGILSSIFQIIKSHLAPIFNILIGSVKKFIEALSKIPGVLFEITKSTIAFSKIMSEKLMILTQSIISIPLNILEKAQELGYEIKKEMNEFAQTFENLQKDFMGDDFIGKRFQALQENLISARKNFMDVNEEAVQLFGRGIAGINKAFQETQSIVKSLGVFSSIFAEQITKNKENAFYYFKMKQIFDLTDDDLQYIARIASNTGKSLSTVFESLSGSIKDAAKSHRQDTKQMARDYIDMRKNVISFGHITDKELGNVVARTRQMRVEMKDAVSLFEKIQTFEDAANMASQLSQSFNMVIDSMELLKAESPDQMLKLLRDAMFSTGRSFSQLNRFEKSLLQQQTGLSSEAMQALFSFENAGKSYQEIMEDMKEKDPVQQQISSINAMKDAIVELKETMPKFQNSFDAFFTGIKDNTLLSDQLRKNLSSLSFSFDDVYKAALNGDIAQFEPALQAISNLILRIKEILTDSGFIKSLNNITVSMSNIIENFLNQSLFEISEDYSKKMTENLSNILDEILPTFKKLFSIGSRIVESFILTISYSFDDLFEIILQSMLRILNKDFFSNLLSAIDTSLSNIVSFLTKQETYQKINEAIIVLFDFSKSFIEIGLKQGEILLKAIIDGITNQNENENIFKKIQSFFTKILKKIFGDLDQSFSSQNLEEQGIFQRIFGNLNSDKILKSFKNIAGTIFKIMIDVVDNVLFAVAQILPKIADALSKFANEQDPFEQLFGEDAKSKFKRITESLGTIVGSLFSDGESSILGSLFKLADKFFDYISKFKTKEGKGLSDLFMDLIGLAVNYYYDFYSSIFKTVFKNFGEEIITAVSLGFLGAIGTMKLFGNIIKQSIVSGGAIHARQIALVLGQNHNTIAGYDFDQDAVTGDNKQGSRGKGWKGMSGAGKLAAVGGIAASLGMMALDANSQKEDKGFMAHAQQTAEWAMMGASIGSIIPGVGTGIGAAVGGLAGLGSSLFMQDGFISKDGKIVKIHDNDNVIAFKENGPIMNSASRQSNNISNSASMIKPEDLKVAVRDAIIEGFKSQNQTIEVKLNGEKVGEGLLASGFVNMMTNTNKSKGAPTINPNSVIYRDGQIPSSGYISQ